VDATIYRIQKRTFNYDIIHKKMCERCGTAWESFNDCEPCPRCNLRQCGE